MKKEIRQTGMNSDLIIHPGETIAEIIIERGILKSDLATRVGVSNAYISYVLAGKKDISPKLAMGLEYALNIPKSFWLKLQANYDAKLLELYEEKSITEGEREVRELLEGIITCLYQHEMISQNQTKDESILSLRKILQISNLENLKDVTISNKLHISEKTTNPYVLGAWMRLHQVVEDKNKINQESGKVRIHDLLPEEKKKEETYRSIRGSIINAQKSIYKAVNFAMVNAYWEIGEQIYIACGEQDRAEYGKNLLEYLSEKLTIEFGKGFDRTNLIRMRKFYISFPIRDALRHELSWTHYRLLLKVSDEKARIFYMEEAAKAGWSSRQLERQMNTMYYQRILASKDKESVAAEIELKEPKPEYEKILKDPYVLEFLDLPANSHFYENDLEQALIDHLQKFLLELGRGFSFVARQKHINVDGRHFYIDLVFYNYLLKCFVLVDLKMGDLTHQDIGQMQMYVNYYTRELMNEGDNPPIGLLLCADKSDTLVQYTLPENNNQIYAAKYLPYMPTVEELRKELNLEEFEQLS